MDSPAEKLPARGSDAPHAYDRGLIGATRRWPRLVAVIGVLLLALMPATLLAEGTPPATGPAGGFASGGLGLTRAQWEARVGPGETGQGAEWYRVNGLQLNVLFDPGRTGRIYSIDWHAPAKAGVPFDQATMPLPTAKAETTTLLPADAVLRETFDAPGAGIHPVLLVQLYHSDTLARVFSSKLSGSGDFVACYLLSGALVAYGADVLEVDLFVGTPPV